ncbi:hypothetical protein DHW03_01385 [Pedobacter yonginense]|uniref:Uncharacterized protein n=1 Tax=Pedobacter yonginense TaxID=651869 RepID=A0A317EQW7_9SPHI|nr:hypothetical protein [Pedobacter yonginense]PWS28537.1 hypothetical protein DHW03_01385 [Pedobacter yonginense]
MKILITGGNHAKALKLLKAFPNHFVLLADYGEIPVINTEKYAFASLGKLNEDSIAHILLNFCITEAIDSIIPLHNFEVLAIAKSSVLFGEYGIQVVLPEAEVIDQYLGEKAPTFPDFAVFISGECIFTSNTDLPKVDYKNLNGVFAFNKEGFKLFTI